MNIFEKAFENAKVPFSSKTEEPLTKEVKSYLVEGGFMLPEIKDLLAHFDEQVEKHGGTINDSNALIICEQHHVTSYGYLSVDADPEIGGTEDYFVGYIRNEHKEIVALKIEQDFGQYL